MEDRDKKRKRSDQTRGRTSRESSRIEERGQWQGMSPDRDEFPMPGYCDRPELSTALSVEQQVTETIDLAALFTANISATGSFDVGSEIWTTTFGKLLQALPIPALLIDASCCVLQANQACAKISPTYQKILGGPFSGLFPGSGVSGGVQSLLEEVFSTRKTRVAQAVLQIEDARIWARMTFRSVRITRERFILALIEDLTSEKKEIHVKEKLTRDLERRVEERAEEIRKSEATYRNILETIADGYYQVDLAGNLTLINDSLCELIGYSREELLGMSYRRLMDEANTERMHGACSEVYKTGISNSTFDLAVLRKDGTKRQLSASIALIKDSNGRPAGFAAFSVI